LTVWALSAARIDRITSKPSAACVDSLCELIADAIDAGDSVGFVQPANLGALKLHWQSVFMGLGEPGIALWVARQPGESEKVIGCVQVVLTAKPSASHRAEIDKLIIHSSMRNRKVGAALLATAEAYAKAHQRQLVVLNAPSGSSAEKMFQHMAYSVAGRIPDFDVAVDGSLQASSAMFKRLSAKG
jgi:acetyltransferase